MKSKPSLSSGSVRQKVIVDLLSKSIGQKVFLLTQPYPFVVIGSIMMVKHDFVRIDLHVNSLSEAQQGMIHIRIEDIEAFYIEEAGPKISNDA